MIKSRAQMNREDNRRDSLSSLSNFLSFTGAHFPVEKRSRIGFQAFPHGLRYFFNRLHVEKNII